MSALKKSTQKDIHITPFCIRDKELNEKCGG